MYIYMVSCSVFLPPHGSPGCNPFPSICKLLAAFLRSTLGLCCISDYQPRICVAHILPQSAYVLPIVIYTCAMYLLLIYIHMLQIHTHTHIYLYKYTHTHIYMYIHIYLYMYIHTYIHIYIHTYIHTFIYIYIYIYTYTYIYIYIYICAQ